MDLDFVDRLRTCAEIVGSVAGLARAAGLSQSGIRKYFDGAEPTRPVLIELAKATCVSLIWLVNGTAPACQPTSPLVVRAEQEIALHFMRSRVKGLMGDLPLGQSIDRYCEIYNEGSFYSVPGAGIEDDEQPRQEPPPEALPQWVSVILPRIEAGEFSRWHHRDFTQVPAYFASWMKGEASRKSEGWLEAPSELVVMVMRELQAVFGEAYASLDQRKEAYILGTVIPLLLGLRSQIDDPEFPIEDVLRGWIQFAGFQYEKQKTNPTNEDSS